MLPKELSELINLYLNGNCTPAEKQQVENWYETYQATEKEFHDDNEALITSSAQRSLARLHLKISLAEPKKIKWIKPLWFRRMAAAAILLLFLCAGLMVYRNFNRPAGNYYANDVAPGKNKAVLTLADGSKIMLNDALNGEIGVQSGIKITKTKDGQLTYTIRHLEGGTTERPVSGRTLPAVEMPNTIETPRGGQYQIRLEDGTTVWLNAASSLKFPSSFHTMKERQVTLTGEGYFEVAKNPKKPFIVHTDGQDVKVLGTHFNINAYKEEPDIRTTLLEGAVRVSFNNHEVVLKPGEQAVHSSTSIRVHAVDIDNTIAWKNGKFKFVNENIHDLMRNIARWYDVEVVYEGNMVNKDFSGSVSRFESVSKILDVLESTNTVHFRVEGRRITVMP